MDWLLNLSTTQPVAHAILILALVCAAGMALGSVRIAGVQLGPAGVLFAGLVLGQFFRPASDAALSFAKDFGLILFLFTIGLQLGPGFFASLRAKGLRLNLLAAAIGALGAFLAPAIGALAAFDPAATLGIFSGATTNMPSLGAAMQTVAALPNVTPERAALPALAAAVTFPVSIFAGLGCVLLLRILFRIDAPAEAQAFTEASRRQVPPVERRTMRVTNPRLDKRLLGSLSEVGEAGVSLSVVRHGHKILPATGDTVLHVGDFLTAVGTAASLDHFERLIGERAEEDLVLVAAGLTFRPVIVTHGDVLGRSIGDIDFGRRFGVTVTRVSRSDIEVPATPDLVLRFGDRVVIVGRREAIDEAAALLGDSVKMLDTTHFVPLFVGILAGVVIGAIPIAIPGLPEPVQLGLAAGPLLAALLLGRFGRIATLAAHMPMNANLAFREFGLSLFYAAVGLQASQSFFANAFSPQGGQWLLAGLAVTIVPVLAVGSFARFVWKLNFVELGGLIAGAMTNAPTLVFASNMARDDSPALAYTTVFPLAMVLRVLSAQVLAIALLR